MENDNGGELIGAELYEDNGGQFWLKVPSVEVVIYMGNDVDLARGALNSMREDDVGLSELIDDTHADDIEQLGQWEKRMMTGTNDPQSVAPV